MPASTAHLRLLLRVPAVLGLADGGTWSRPTPSTRGNTDRRRRSVRSSARCPRHGHRLRPGASASARRRSPAGGRRRRRLRVPPRRRRLRSVPGAGALRRACPTARTGWRPCAVTGAAPPDARRLAVDRRGAPPSDRVRSGPVVDRADRDVDALSLRRPAPRGRECRVDGGPGPRCSTSGHCRTASIGSKPVPSTPWAGSARPAVALDQLDTRARTRSSTTRRALASLNNAAHDHAFQRAALRMPVRQQRLDESADSVDLVHSSRGDHVAEVRAIDRGARRSHPLRITFNVD